jgi:hypothetical protein
MTTLQNLKTKRRLTRADCGHYLLRRGALRAAEDGETLPPMEAKSATNWLQSNPAGGLCVTFSSAPWLTTVSSPALMVVGYLAIAASVIKPNMPQVLIVTPLGV